MADADNVRPRNFGENLIALRLRLAWSRRRIVKLCGGQMTRIERQRLYASIKNAEDRRQRVSLLISPFSRIFGIPARVLMSEDLTRETLDTLHAKFGFDPAEVERRALDFDY